MIWFDEILLPRYINLSISGLPLRVEMAPSHLKRIYSVLFGFTWRPIFVIGLSVALRKFPSRFLKCFFSTSVVVLLGWKLLVLLVRCSFSLQLLSVMLFVIVYLLPSSLFYWSEFDCILVFLFGMSSFFLCFLKFQCVSICWVSFIK